MEQVEIITTLVANVGFPICCSIAMFWLMWKERKAHEQESAGFMEALNRNTSVMEKVLEKLDGYGHVE